MVSFRSAESRWATSAALPLAHGSGGGVVLLVGASCAAPFAFNAGPELSLTNSQRAWSRLSARTPSTVEVPPGIRGQACNCAAAAASSSAWGLGPGARGCPPDDGRGGVPRSSSGPMGCTSSQQGYSAPRHHCGLWRNRRVSTAEDLQRLLGRLPGHLSRSDLTANRPV